MSSYVCEGMKTLYNPDRSSKYCSCIIELSQYPERQIIRSQLVISLNDFSLSPLCYDEKKPSTEHEEWQHLQLCSRHRTRLSIFIDLSTLLFIMRAIHTSCMPICHLFTYFPLISWTFSARERDCCTFAWAPLVAFEGKREMLFAFSPISSAFEHLLGKQLLQVDLRLSINTQLSSRC